MAGLLLSTLLGRHLGAAGLGVWTATAAIGSIIIGFASFGTDSIVVRRMAVHLQQASEWLGNGIGIRLFASLPLACLLIVLATTALNRDSIPMVFAFGYALYAGFASINGILCRGCQALNRFSWQLYPLLLGTLPALGAMYLWLRSGGHIFGVVACAAAGQLSGMVLTALIMRKSVDTTPRCSAQRWKSILAESWPLAVSAPFLAAYTRVDSVMLMNMQGATSVGYYGAAYAFFMAFGGLGSSVQSVLFPILAKTYVESPEKARRLFHRGLRWMVALGVAGAAVTFMVGEKVLTLVYGASFKAAGAAFEILMVGSIFLLLNNMYGMTINAVGRQKMALYITVGGLITNIAVNLFLIPRFDFVGAAWATVITEMVVLFLCHAGLAPAWKRKSEPATA